MRRCIWVLGLVMASWLGGMSFLFAESRPLKQLPGDLVRWSTIWKDIPQQMYEVGQESGPVAAVLWGPTKGTAVMVQSTTKELWSVMKPDQRQDHDSYDVEEDSPTGLILRYEF